jgi:hypothetical protein
MAKSDFVTREELTEAIDAITVEILAAEGRIIERVDKLLDRIEELLGCPVTRIWRHSCGQSSST